MSKVEQSVITVGIGASAGGLEAFKVLFECLTVNTGLSFVVVQHLAAGQESMLTDILSRFTKMPVQSVKDRMSVEPNHVYVIPAGTTMTMKNTTLNLNSELKSLRPIDTFFVSLAEDLKNQSIGIVLSGTGSDGTEGLKASKHWEESRSHRLQILPNMVTCLKVLLQQKQQTLFYLPKRLQQNYKKSLCTLNYHEAK